MKVRATKTGFYESLRSVGDVFHVPDGETASWFVAVDETRPDHKPDKPKGKKEDDSKPA